MAWGQEWFSVNLMGRLLLKQSDLRCFQCNAIFVVYSPMTHPRKTAKRKNRGGRPRAEYDLRLVQLLASKGATILDIAHFCSVSARTVNRWKKIPEFLTAISRGMAWGRLKLRRKMLEVALRGDTRMLIWLGKIYLGQSDNPRQGAISGL